MFLFMNHDFLAQPIPDSCIVYNRFNVIVELFYHTSSNMLCPQNSVQRRHDVTQCADTSIGTQSHVFGVVKVTYVGMNYIQDIVIYNYNTATNMKRLLIMHGMFHANFSINVNNGGQVMKRKQLISRAISLTEQFLCRIKEHMLCKSPVCDVETKLLKIVSTHILHSTWYNFVMLHKLLPKFAH